MPTYEYECLENGHRFEKFQRFSETPVQECPVCGSPVRRLLFPPPVIFKGPGFYKTEYGKQPAENAEAAPKPESKTQTESTESSETKATSEAASED